MGMYWAGALLLAAGLALPATSQDASSQAADSQSASVVRIGVALASIAGDPALDAEVRNQLVKALNRRKPDKKWKRTLEAVALDSPAGGRALAEAERKRCEYVLYTRVKGRENTHRFQAAADGSILQNQPLTIVTMEFLLRGVADSETYAAGTVKSDEAPSDNEAVLQTTGRISRKLLDDLGKNEDLHPVHTAVAGTLEKMTPIPSAESGASEQMCDRLPQNLTHTEALRGVCLYAMRLRSSMPNVICQEETVRYEGQSNVPLDLITATVRYEDGDESYSDLKLNGKPEPESVAQSAGLWSSGQFEGSNLRAIFHPANQPRFEFLRDDQTAGRQAWVFKFEIDQQQEPLWQLRGEDQVTAPPYRGEVWVDQQSGAVLRFWSAAKELPRSFPMQSAEMETDYGRVDFADGTDFVLPVSSSIATRYVRMEPTRNVVQFRGCHKFRAKTRMLLDAASGTPAGETIAASSVEALKDELAQNQTIYDILRQQAIREDEARLELEQQLDLNLTAFAVFRHVAALERERQAVLAKEEMAASAAKNSAAQSSSAQAAAAGAGLDRFRVNVNLVPVSVVTRDARGRAVGDLAKDNFRLFDEKKPQLITRFDVEQNETASAKPDASHPAPAESKRSAVENTIAYVFDDLHAGREDLTNAEQAAEKYLAELRAHDRAALFTISSETTVDFTSDRNQLLAALRTLKPRTHPAWDCPQMTYYMADRIVNQGDAEASGIAVSEAMQCEGYAPGGQYDGRMAMAERLAVSRALEVALAGRVDSDRTLHQLAEIIRRTAAMPGRKSIVLVSPGFLTVAPDTQDRAMALIDSAVAANIIVNVLDVTGLTTPVEASPMNGPETIARNEVMANLAYGTGGTFFHNNNDINEGFRQTSDIPEYIYVLGFSPQKLDGKFHRLKVSLSGREKLTVQARPGYYAIRPDANP